MGNCSCKTRIADGFCSGPVLLRDQAGAIGIRSSSQQLEKRTEGMAKESDAGMSFSLLMLIHVRFLLHLLSECCEHRFGQGDHPVCLIVGNLGFKHFLEFLPTWAGLRGMTAEVASP